jgi:hypothetical protein
VTVQRTAVVPGMGEMWKLRGRMADQCRRRARVLLLTGRGGTGELWGTALPAPASAPGVGSVAALTQDRDDIREADPLGAWLGAGAGAGVTGVGDGGSEWDASSESGIGAGRWEGEGVSCPMLSVSGSEKRTDILGESCCGGVSATPLTDACTRSRPGCYRRLD